MKSFKRFLAESITVPSVVYRSEKPGASAGHWFAFDRDTAEAYAADDPGYVVNSYRLTIRKPLILSTPESVRDFWAKWDMALPRHHHTFPEHQLQIAAELGKAGYDALVVPHSAFEGELGYKWAAGTFGEPQVLVFHPERQASRL